MSFQIWCLSAKIYSKIKRFDLDNENLWNAFETNMQVDFYKNLRL